MKKLLSWRSALLLSLSSLLVLTVQSVPAVPDTGFRLTINTPAITLVITLFATTALLIIAGRYTKQI